MIRPALLLIGLLSSLPVWCNARLTPAHPPQDQDILNSQAYLSGHPDLRWRNRGLDALAEAATRDGVAYLQRAARYADKASQAVLGQIYWTGDGVEQDRALGYVWMDLAAERLYPGYVALRERYWSQMTPTEQAAARQRGPALYAEYGDEVAKPRMEAVLRQHRAQRTGSRAGANLGADVYQGNPPGLGMKGGSNGMRLRGFHDARFWQPEAYWAWQDEAYGTLRVARVRVLELKPRSERQP